MKINILTHTQTGDTLKVLFTFSFACKLELVAQKNPSALSHTYDLGLIPSQHYYLHTHRLMLQFSVHLNSEGGDCCKQFCAGNVHVMKGMLSLEI